MDINIFNDRKNKTATVRIISDDPVMEELIETVLSTLCERTEKSPSLTVVCVKQPAMQIKGACVYIGNAPESLSEMQVVLPRPLDILEFAHTCRDMIAKRTVFSESGWGADAEKGSAAFNGKEVRLSQKETELFILLLSRVGECVERREIESVLWGDKDCGNDCDVYICHLRKKLESIAGPGVIVSVRGRGYMLKKP